MPDASKDWLKRARAGSAESLGAALEECRRYLLDIAHRELNPNLQVKGSASDMVQETFLEAQRDFQQFRGESSTELRAWLRQLLLHRVCKLARRYQNSQKRDLAREIPLEGAEHALFADAATPRVQAMAEEQATGVERALSRLPEEYRQIIVWRHHDRCPFEEIARRLGRSVPATRRLWLRAIENLQQEVKRIP